MKETSKKPWTTCVTLSYKARVRSGSTDGGWWASMKWTWGRFMDPEMVQGAIENRYPTGMRRAIDQVMDMADQFGVALAPGMKMALFVDDEEGEESLPRDWKNKVRREADRRGWESYSTEREHENR